VILANVRIVGVTRFLAERRISERWVDFFHGCTPPVTGARQSSW